MKLLQILFAGIKGFYMAWKFIKFMNTLGYRQSKGDHTLFIKHSNSGGVWLMPIKGLGRMDRKIKRKKMQKEVKR